MSDQVQQTLPTVEEVVPVPAPNLDLQYSQAHVDELQAQIDGLKLDAERASLWAAENAMQLHFVRGAINDFARRAVPAPWKPNEPRVVGFRQEFDAMVAVAAKPEPKLLTREQLADVKRSMYTSQGGADDAKR